MKLDPVFTVKERKLIKISDNSAVDPSTLEKIEVKWSDIELSPEVYNEEFLAALREQLKVLDESGKFAVIVPVVDKPLATPDHFELFVNAYNHMARRVKDCVSVAGLELPDVMADLGNSAIESFMETLAIKHAQYVYFTKSMNIRLENVVAY